MKIGIILRSATERIDESPSGRLVEGVLAAVNEYDNEVRKERAKIAMWRRVEEGLWPWMPPLGYTRPVKPGVRLSPCEWDEGCYLAVIDIFKFYSTGVYTFSSLFSLMKQRQVKNWQGRIIKFSKQLIQRVLSNPFYVGQLKGKEGKYYEGKHKSLVDVQLWNKCQQIVKERSNHAVNKRVYNNPDFPLRRFVQCLICGRPLTACWSKGKSGQRYAYYYCVNRTCIRYGKAIPENDLRDAFFEYLKKVTPKEEYVEKFKEIFIKRYQQRLHDIKGEYLSKIEEIKQLEEGQIWLVENGKRGVIPETLLKSQLLESEQKIVLAKMALNETHVEELELDAMLNYALAFIRTPELIWLDAEPEAKCKYQRMIFPNGVFYGEAGFSNTEISLPFKIIEDFVSVETNVVRLAGIEPTTDALEGRCSIL